MNTTCYYSVCCIIQLQYYRKIRKPKIARLPNAIIGGLLMGIASRIAPGCSIANLITGIGGLSISSVIVIIGMMIGIFIVVAYIFRMPMLLFFKG